MNIEHFLLRLLNPLFFRTRTFLRHRKGIPNLHAEPYPKESWSSSTQKKEEKLLKSYGQSISSTPLSWMDYQLNLYHLDLLDTVTRTYSFPSSLRTIDVGSKNFYYAPALHDFWNSKGTLKCFEGIELDAYRVYRDFHSRYDYAQAYIQKLTHTSYLPMDFLHYTKSVNVITMFLPFVFERPLLMWGLPFSSYQPLLLMKHAYEQLEEGGIWIITNQGEEEYQEQHRLLKTLGISYQEHGQFLSPFYPFELPQYITVIIK